MSYKEPRIEILKCVTKDVICVSVDPTYEGDDGNGSSASGSWAQTTN